LCLQRYVLLRCITMYFYIAIYTCSFVVKLQQKYQISFIILAGFPATTVFLGTSFVTIEPAATTELSPIVTPAKITQFPPTHTSLPILIGIVYPLLFLSKGSIE